MQFSQILGQDYIKSHLTKTASSGRIPHAQLFIGPEGSGTLATVTTFDPYNKILLTHIALLQPGSVEDRESEWAKKWVNSLEQYSFAENNGTTDLTIDMKIYDEWEDMFNNDWPKALARLKQICEE